MTHAVATQAMIPDGRGGKIVNVTLSPHHGLPGMAHSSAARAAVENLTRVLSIEWARFGIRLTALAAGHFATETLRTKYPQPVVEGVAGTVPLGRLGTRGGVRLAGGLPGLARRRLPVGRGAHDRRRPRQLVRALAAGGLADDAGSRWRRSEGGRDDAPTDDPHRAAPGGDREDALRQAGSRSRSATR